MAVVTLAVFVAAESPGSPSSSGPSLPPEAILYLSGPPPGGDYPPAPSFPENCPFLLGGGGWPLPPPVRLPELEAAGGTAVTGGRSTPATVAKSSSRFGFDQSASWICSTVGPL